MSMEFLQSLQNDETCIFGRQVNKYIKNMFAQDFMLHHISIKGEVSNCKYHSSGHIYFTMKDADGTINAIMFAGSRREGLKFPMKEATVWL